ncbi:16S rRNA (cytosine(967)-C(5))-methyltransferase RsmB [Bacillus benzoevorans]|uniref:16S rRNA (cytosine(967)-C(5))-methyltransferase n=1 Tax=Bacillus benzoevorans TaxID=1456 RepID=A0A7X0LTR9_9BACI|nr:16S rRNA (cytosine(967)-C(5))-methyltransferase RsmB [Bacillus benzoevorans]MBB6443788.1 16S rRNA (cytosine967-C5)-methyltransferase [Bacillus benzoevorans]
MKTKKKNVRETALDILEGIEKNQSYSNLMLNHAIKKNELDQKDIPLLTELTYGTLQRKITLDYFLAPFIAEKKLESWVRQLLRLTLYQMFFLDKIPDRAAIFEAVEIAKKRGHKGISSLVNGVLRSIQREGLPSFAEISDNAERLAVKTSHPLWLVKRWITQFGFEVTEEMCELNLTAPEMSGRVNLTRISREECLAMLEEEGFAVKASDAVPEAIICLKGNLANSSAFQTGLLTIQDESSMTVAHALGAKEQQRILDACAAPGGKTTHIAEQLRGTGQVIALDLHEHKVKLIRDNAQRLGLANIRAEALDSRKVQEHFENESFDRILLDAPCSGLGVMRRKPDLKYTKNETDLLKLQDIQISLLESAAPLLKKGGILVYSTCTIDQEENQNVVKAFLEKHPEFEFDLTVKNRLPERIRGYMKNGELQILPQYMNSDGFYIACLRKKVQ